MTSAEASTEVIKACEKEQGHLLVTVSGENGRKKGIGSLWNKENQREEGIIVYTLGSN